MPQRSCSCHHCQTELEECDDLPLPEGQLLGHLGAFLGHHPGQARTMGKDWLVYQSLHLGQHKPPLSHAKSCFDRLELWDFMGLSLSTFVN